MDLRCCHRHPFPRLDLLSASCTAVNLEALDSGEWAASQLTYPCRAQALHPPGGNHANSQRSYRTRRSQHLANSDSGLATGQWPDAVFQALLRRSGVIEARWRSPSESVIPDRASRNSEEWDERPQAGRSSPTKRPLVDESALWPSKRGVVETRT